MHGSKLSDQFIQSDAVPSGTLLIPNKFGTLFELGVQRLETLEKLEIQYSQALAKPKRQKIAFCSPVSLSLQSAT